MTNSEDKLLKNISKEILREATLSRRQANIRTFFFILLFGGLFVFNLISNNEKITIPEGEPYVSIVRINGVIDVSSSASPRFLEPILTRAFYDKQSKGVLLLINSPGGTPVQSHILHKLITHLKDKTGKKVVAVGEDMLTSGAYMLATSADQIYVNESTMTGSIGVVQQSYGYSALLEQIGVEARTIQAGENKVRLNPLLPTNQKDLEKIQGVLNQVHENFIEVVRSGRGERLIEDSVGLFSGDYWTGKTAVTYGLVDGIGSANEIMAKEFSVEHAKDYSQQRGIMSGLSDMLSSVIADSLVKASQTINIQSLQGTPQPRLQ